MNLGSVPVRMTRNSISLEEIIAGCREGRESAMKKFYEHFRGYAMTICMGYAGNHDDALEMMHDGFLKAFKNLHKLDNAETVRPWFRRILVNTAIDYHRRNANKQTVELTDYQIPTGEYSSESVYAKLSSEDIMNAVQSLPDMYRMVFNLYVIEGYSHREIAEQLQIAEGTSRAHLSMANASLRKILQALL
jgi:RNA polymerase sigma factor (sigma-70 family)